MEYWENTKNIKRRTVTRGIVRICGKNASCVSLMGLDFLYPVFQYSIIPSFHTMI
jgi:hypothetical protein